MANTVESPAERLKVFISYARSDGAALAEDLVTGLELADFAPFLDRHDIAAAEDWETRLGELIQGADTVVFIISPAAIKSERCAWEVECAAKFGKRLIPVRLIPPQGDPVAESDVPERLRRLNYVFFHEGQSSLKPISELATALRQDVEWIREHTRLTEAAVRWEARSRAGGAADDLLLRGDDLRDATAWAARRKENAPEITALQRSYLAASEAYASSLADAERKRLDERERLIAETEAAQQGTFSASYVRGPWRVRCAGRCGDGSRLMGGIHKLAGPDGRPLAVRRRAGGQEGRRQRLCRRHADRP
jgi:hypothetical protein